MAYEPPFYKRLQRKFPQKEEAAAPEVEETAAPVEVKVEEPSLEDALAGWEDVASEVDADDEDGFEFDDPSTPEIEWSESQLKSELLDLATSLDLEVSESNLKREIADALRASDKAREI